MIGFWLTIIPANLTPVAIGIDGGFILLAIGITAAIGQLLMTYSYKALPVSQGSIIVLVTPVTNILIGMTVFGESIAPVTGLGMLLILVACTLIGLQK